MNKIIVDNNKFLGKEDNVIISNNTIKFINSGEYEFSNRLYFVYFLIIGKMKHFLIQALNDYCCQPLPCLFFEIFICFAAG